MVGKVIATLVALMLAASVAYAAPKRTGVTPGLVEGVIALLSFNYEDSDWTKSGKPRVDAVERVLKADISAADRDAAWKAFNTPPVGVSVEKDATIRKLTTERNNAGLRASQADKEIGRLTAALLQVRSSSKARIRAAESVASSAKRQFQRLLDDIESNVTEARRMKMYAAQLVREAEARERGAGPKASRDCRDALNRYVVNGDRTWVGNLELSGVGMNAIKQGCLVR